MESWPGSVPAKFPRVLTLFTPVFAAVFALAGGCAARNTPPKPTKSAARPVSSRSTNPDSTSASAPASGPSLAPRELIALERSPGSTPPLTQAVEPEPAPVAGLAGTPGVSPAYGPEDAPVRIYLFSDFGCPVCPRVVEPIKHLARVYPKDVRIVFKENALVSHPGAARLAAASLAAFRQGKFWEFHDRLFANPSRTADADLIDHAQALGLDVGRFRSDLDDEAVIEQVKYEWELAKSVGLPATPGMIVNGRRQSGWGSYMGLENIVKQELVRARKIAEGGVPASRVAYEATRQSGPDGEKLAAALFAVPK